MWTFFKKSRLAFALLHTVSCTYANNDLLQLASSRSLMLRQTPPTSPETPPETWRSLGCVTDGPGTPRTLQGASQAGQNNTIESCKAFCDSKQFVYAGVEYGIECYCDNTISTTGKNAAASDCNMTCAGNKNEFCGANNRLNLFWNGKPPPPPPVIPQKIGNWTSLGCYSDNVNNTRTLSAMAVPPGQVTLENCTTVCFKSGFRFSGAEYSTECYCGSIIAHTAGPATLTDCNTPCAGNTSELCGGANRLSLYNYTGTDLPPRATMNVFPLKSGLPMPWAYNACWADNVNGRISPLLYPLNPNNTVESCIKGCASMNYTVAGLEYGDECFCGNSLVNGPTIADEADCNVGCAGNTTQACGGPNRLSVYSSTPITTFPVPTAHTTELPGQWQYKGCLRENAVGKMFPYMTNWQSNNSAVACMTQCSKFGFTAAGVEYGQECYCGDISDVVNKNGVFGSEVECTTACPGDPIHTCGNGNRLNAYYWSGTVNNWRTPANIGRFEFLVPGVVVPIVAMLGVNNKVAFLEKHGTGPPNSTGAYELDLTLVQNFSATWRTMHVKTDIFCGASLILPDKVGRQISVAGWSLDSTFGVRLYTPDGSEGVNGTNDWQENYRALKLQRGRWYPSAAILANGSVMVIGGEVGSNAAGQPNLEILPKPPGGDTVVHLDFLPPTDPNNLYPFVVILPSKRIFIVYYNEARILDPVTFATVSVLPNIPGAVNDFTAGRTYPLAGALLPLPQIYPYTDPLQVLICGGSTIGGGYALDNCVTAAPEAQNTTWTIERMPSRRVMPCMVPLPDGTIFIANGAHHGVAGFGLGEDPNLNAILYDPTLPIGSRFAVLNNTIVARMYHSEATLLPDGRVLISGSDPQTNWPNGTARYPEEYRIEVYIPPYLNQGCKQPTFDLPTNDWEYGGSYNITNVQFFHGSVTSTLRVSLVAASSSTHGNAMGARTIFPKVTCEGTTCTIVAPPNAGISPPGWHQLFVLDGPTPSHSRWVRIGGDPSAIGNWPNLPGFTIPGI